MGRKIRWPKIKKIWWCFNCNIPILQEECPKCRTKSLRIHLSDPGDARLAFERDYKALYTAYVYEFNTSKGFNDIIGRSVALINKAPYYDEMKEIVVDGVQIGRLYFDPMIRKWRFRLSKISAAKLYASYPDVIETIVLPKKRYRHCDIVRIDRDIEHGKQILLLNNKGVVAGLGYSRGEGKIMVHSWWGVESDKMIKNIENNVYRKTTIEDVIKVHEEYINILTSRAKKFISITYEKINKPLIVSFSGGKDSLVALHLTLTLGLDPVVLFNNTGIELPETISTVYKTIDKYGLKLVEASAEDRFWKAVYDLSIPGRDYRWCCKVCKLAPLSNTVKNLWSNGGLNIVGQRVFESIDRARSPSLWRLRWAPSLLNLSPINTWSQIDVWLYIFTNKLSPNTLYFIGYERIGCFMCPASTLAELELVSHTHKDLWNKWIEVLEYWAKKINMPREWIDYGLWRWHGPARYKSMLAKKLRISDYVEKYVEIFKAIAQPGFVNIEKTEKNLKIELNFAVNTISLENQISVINPNSYEIKNDHDITITWSTARVSIHKGNKITAEWSNEEDIEKIIDVLKLIYRWRLCVECRSCETICPSGAAKLVEINNKLKPTANKTLCINCKFCVYNCPIAEVYVEHVISPIILNNPEAWRRESREHHDKVMEKIRNYIKTFVDNRRNNVVVKNRNNDIDTSIFFTTINP